MGRWWLMLALVWALTACAAAPDPGPIASSRPVRQVLLAPAPGDIYHGVLPAGTAGKEDDMTPATLASYENAAGREAAWVHLSNKSRTSGTPSSTPHRDVGPVHVHGIAARDVLEAPDLADVAPFLIDALDGRVFVARNASFDLRFLASRLGALGYPRDDGTPCVCTMQWSSHLLRGARSRKLGDCCAARPARRPGLRAPRECPRAHRRGW